jgi:hypothetical protein
MGPTGQNSAHLNTSEIRELHDRFEQRQTGAGTVRFYKTSWSDLPTMHH